jgi:vacuolar-type H+-ATPase subunit I/STV1
MPMQLRTRNILAAAVIGASVVFGANAADMDTAIDKGVNRAAQAQQSQQKIDSIDNSIRSAERDYRAVIKESDGLKVYIEQLDKQLAAQHEELSGIDKSIEQVTLVERQITPLMLRMIDSIDQFVKADVPFLVEERGSRVEKLKALMGRSDVTVAEKYRKVMEAYQSEIDYGRTIESYRGTLDGREVDFLRVGRISLIYQTLDGQELGVYNTTSKAWQPLDSEFKSKVIAAIRIAREQAAPDLIKVPVAAPQESK